MTRVGVERVEVVSRWQDCPPLTGDDAAVVIDVLRATTSMARAAEAGVTRVLPVAEVESARALKTQHPTWLLVGERENRPPPGFDRGNSPFDWAAADAGRTAVWTTTNGTAALQAAGDAGRVAAAALVNRRAAVAWILKQGRRRVVLVGAGEHGRSSVEDLLAAGAIAAELPDDAWTGSAADAVRRFRDAESNLAETLAAIPHARRLTEAGLGGDVAFAARLDAIPWLLVRRRAGSAWLVPVAEQAGG